MKIDGAQVVNGTYPIRFVITPSDIRASKPKDPTNCAAARACKRQLMVSEVRIHLQRVFLKVGNEWLRFYTPNSLRREIIQFDRGHGFEPGEHVLRPLTKTKLARFGKRQGSSTNDNQKRHKARKKLHITPGVRGFAPRGG